MDEPTRKRVEAVLADATTHVEHAELLVANARPRTGGEHGPGDEEIRQLIHDTAEKLGYIGTLIDSQGTIAGAR